MPRGKFNAFLRAGKIQSVSKNDEKRDKMSNRVPRRQICSKQCQNLLHNVKNAYIKEKIQN